MEQEQAAEQEQAGADKPDKTGKVYSQWMYLAQTLDPVHVGTGDFHLGRVDNMIVRDTGTNLPKIPGSSLAGVARAYAAMRETTVAYPNRYGNCAGKGGDDGGKHCAQADCPICGTFGFSRKEGSFQGLAQFTDARLLFFPVYTLRGTMWISCPSVLAEAGVCGEGGKDMPWGELGAALIKEHTIFEPDGSAEASHLNAGWMYFRKFEVQEEENTGSTAFAKQIGNPLTWTLNGVPFARQQLKAIAGKIAIVDDQVFPVIVEDQLEVRTSVSIDPATGTASKGALFTAEAIPRAAFLYFYVTTLDPKFFRVPTIGGSREAKQAGDDGKQVGGGHAELNQVVKKGLEYAEWLGVGAAGTRGMGRTRIELVGPRPKEDAK